MNRRLTIDYVTEDLWADLVNNVSLHHGARTPTANDIWVALTATDKYIISKIMKYTNATLRDVCEILCRKMQLPLAPPEGERFKQPYIDVTQKYVSPDEIFQRSKVRA